MSDTTRRPGKTFRQMVEEARPHIKMLSPADMKKIIDSGGAMVVDVGEPWQIAARGTIPGARNITRGELEIKADTKLPRRLLELQDRDQKIILTCGAGGEGDVMCEGAAGNGVHRRLGDSSWLPGLAGGRVRARIAQLLMEPMTRDSAPGRSRLALIGSSKPSHRAESLKRTRPPLLCRRRTYTPSTTKTSMSTLAWRNCFSAP
jgi:rhodanese-related sulfurtransferase